MTTNEPRRTHLFAHASGETVEVFTNQYGAPRVLRTIPNTYASADGWGNWVPDILDTKRSGVQQLACFGDFYPLVGRLTLLGFVLVEHEPLPGHQGPTASLAAIVGSS